MESQSSDNIDHDDESSSEVLDGDDEEQRRRRRRESSSCPLLPPTPSVPGYDLLIVGCGCFWTGQLKFQRFDGVIQVDAGYSGGHHHHPTYDDIMDHSEALRIEYDPSQISLRELLHAWTKMHTPDKPVSRRYRSVVWYLGQEQRIVAEEVIQKWRNEYYYNKAKKTVDEGPSPTIILYTSVEPATEFYKAESSHQDYYIRTGQARFVR